MAKQDPRGNFGSPLTARLATQMRNAATDVAKPTEPPPAAAAPVEVPAAPPSNVVDLKARTVEEQGGEATPAMPPKAPPKPNTQPPDTSTTSIRVILNLDEREGLDTLVNGLTRKLGARVKLANLVRANFMLLMEAQEFILARAERDSEEFGKRPANNDALALAQFEDQIKQLVRGGLFDAARRNS